MTALVWDQVGDRMYQTGIDRGVLYLPDRSGVSWNGLVSVSESTSPEPKSFHMDGVKYNEYHVVGDFAGDLKAFTYPEELDALCGTVFDDSVTLHDQQPQPFGLSYRTLMGDDTAGLERGYKIHVFFNLLAIPSNPSYSTLSDVATPTLFSWTLSGIPDVSAGRKPTCHISIDSTKVSPTELERFENQLYGSSTRAPSLPTLAEFFILDEIQIIDNGDGTWTARASSEFLTMLDDTTFQITSVDATYLDADTYEVSSTTI